MSDRLNEPLPFRADGKRFRDLTLVEQNEILFRILEEVLDGQARIEARLAAVVLEVTP